MRGEDHRRVVLLHQTLAVHGRLAGRVLVVQGLDVDGVLFAIDGDAAGGVDFLGGHAQAFQGILTVQSGAAAERAGEADVDFVGMGRATDGEGNRTGRGQATEGFEYFHALSLPFFIVWDVVGN